MVTYFAPAERTGEKELAAEIAAMSNNPLISGLLQTTNGLLAVLDEHRIVVAYNDSFLQILGLEDSAKVLGLRPGEAIQCIHAYDEPGGCGTSKYCCTCGIAVAIVSSLEHNKPAERICALTIKKSDREVDIAVHARCRPIDIDGKKYLLLFLQDISQQQQRAAIERTFFHDLNNIIGMLVGASELLVGQEPSRLAGIVHKVSLRLMEEVVIQRCLLQQTDIEDYQPRRDEIKPGQILTELYSFFSSHPAAYNKKIEFSENYPDVPFNTDSSLMSRVLINMVINALEASAENDVVKLWVEHEGKLLSFCVWNAREIPQEISLRIFQRNFSTKEQAGRGIGTYSMKLFGEQVLGGKVSFTTSREKGTVFKFSLPL